MAMELVIFFPVPGHRLPIIAGPVTIEVGAAKIFSPCPIPRVLAAAVLLIPICGIERARSSRERKRIIVVEKTQHAQRTGADGYVSPLVLCLLSAVRFPVPVVSPIVVTVTPSLCISGN